MQDPSIQDNPLSKQCNTSTCYAAPVMQPHLLCKHLHQLLCRTSNANTCYAKHLLLIQTTAANSRQRAAPIRYAHQNDRTQTRNLSKFRPKFQPKFPTQTHVDFSIEPQHIQNNKQTYTHEMLCKLLNYSGHK